MFDLKLSNSTGIRYLIPEFDPRLEFHYTSYELLLLADHILLNDHSEGPSWLNGSQIVDRWRHEIYTAHGTPDPAIVRGMYWRSHPDGRPFASAEKMKQTGCGFYR